ncbi:asparagine synthase-related protein [Hyphomonas sp. CACIAM 19H1]|uniref:asparagine synthase-related protein n=1 Tax=Hyphomonas sp. CACIAM 19H1 TaxID=1873716 RepID=UPI000DED96FC|nr:asparagine synthase-related protein [Hyphomonas sp. CACIAM 19H1]
MKSFLAFYPTPSSERAARATRELLDRLQNQAPKSATFDLKSLSVFDLSYNGATRSRVAIEMPSGGECYLYGDLFRSAVKGPQSPVEALTAEEKRRLENTGGASLLKDFWGSYVGFYRHKDELFILADIAGSIPCYHMEIDDVHLFFSHLEHCDILDRTRLTINYPFLQRLLAYDKIQTGETGLKEVAELLPGMRWRVVEGVLAREQVWDPRTLAAAPLKLKDADAMDMLRDTTLSVVQSRANAHGSVTVSLSGGLDSSIVLGCLAKHRWQGDVNALHHSLGSEDPSEYRFADMVAQAAERDLFELPTPIVETLEDPETHPLSARPHRSFGAINPQALAQRHHAPLGAAVFTGQGGDHLFLASDLPLGFADYLQESPRGGRIPSELLSAARLSGLSIWEVLKQTLPYTVGRKPESSLLAAIQKRSTDVNSEALFSADLETTLPDWVTNPLDLPPGKFSQVNHLFHMFQIRSVLTQPGQPETCHPLISQPLIELCLRLPVYQLCLNGTNRGLAREAFREYLPDAVRLRVTKGNASRYYAATLERHLSKIAARLADGALVQAGLIRKEDVLHFMSADGITLRKWRRMALIYYAIEAWLTRWSTYLRQG